MKVKELIALLQRVSPDAEVLVPSSADGSRVSDVHEVIWYKTEYLGGKLDLLLIPDGITDVPTDVVSQTDFSDYGIELYPEDVVAADDEEAGA
jgi:hypothetical protein